MNYLKKMGISLGFSFGLFFIFTFVITLLEYIGFISNNILKIILTIMIFISFLAGGIIFGKRSIKKGWWEGIKLSIINIGLILIISLILNNVVPKSIILYLIIFFSTTIGSIIGVNNRKIQN